MTSWKSAHFSLSVRDSVESWPYFLLCKLQLIPYSSPHLLKKNLGAQEENNRLRAGREKERQDFSPHCRRLLGLGLACFQCSPA